MEHTPARILQVDLTTGAQRVSEVPPEDERRFLGGAGLAARLLYPSLTPDLDPLDPRAPLLFMSGPLTGTAGPSVGRAVICARSPATGLWGESNIGGHIGPEIRAGGYEGVLVTGAAADPVYLWLHEGQVEIRPAAGLWGETDTYQTQERIRAETGERLARVACIGRGGEARIPFASVMCDHGRLAGRTGMGAVMGAKNLKALAVRGRRPVPLARPAAFGELRRTANLELREDNVSRALRAMGTAQVMDYFAYLGEMPAHYFTRGQFEGAEKLSGAAVAETILSGVSTCHGCVIACGRLVRLRDGVQRKGPEYETTVGFGPNLGIDDIEAVTMLGERCDRYGLDTISLSNVIGLAFLMYEQGVLTRADTGGLALAWGNVPAAEELIEQTVRGEALGRWIGQGARRMAARFGVPEMAVEVNGLEVAYHDPRGASGMALIYATSPRGACHNQSHYYLVDAVGQTMEEIGVGLFGRQDGAEKAANVALHQDWVSVLNSLVMCLLANVPPRMTLDLTNAATGWDYTLEELRQTGERAWNLKRAINHRLGYQRSQDRLPAALLKPLAEGGSAGYVPPFEAMLSAYYRARGWEEHTGRPSRVRLAALGLEDIARDLGLPMALEGKALPIVGGTHGEDRDG